MRKDEKTESATDEKRSRAKYICPPVLAASIEWANYLKPEIPLPPLDNIFIFHEEIEKRLQAVSDKEYTFHSIFTLEKEDTDKMNVWELWTYSDARIYADLLIHLAHLTAENIGKPFPTTKSNDLGNPEFVAEFINLYTIYRTDILITIEIAKALDEIRKGKQEKSEWRFPYTAYKFINESGKIDDYPHSFLLGELKNIDYDRIRICEVCPRIFWAYNKNSFTCSAACANRLRVKRHRQLSEEEKEARKAQRKANESLVKAGKAKTSKKGESK